MSFLFWEERCFLVYGNGEIRIVELEPDLSGVRKGGLRRTLFETQKEGMRLRCEGCRALIEETALYICCLLTGLKTAGAGRWLSVHAAWRDHIKFRVLMDDDCGFRTRCGPGHAC